MINKLTTDLNHIQALDDEPNDVTGLTPTQLKAVFDQAPNDIKTYINSLVDILNSTTDGSSGADNISATSITDLDGATTQAILESIRNKLKSVTDGSSGADYVNATAINGLVGATVQTLLEALKTYVDTHKTSSDHDTRYYSKDQLQSITTGSSGADIIKSTPISANSGNTVQQQLAWLLTQIAIAATGAIPDGSIGQEKLTLLLSTKIDTALSNTGLLTTLTTTDKSSLVNAINEVLNNLTSHLADYTRQPGYAVTTGTSTAYIATLNPVPTSYTDGMAITILPHVDCGATPTLNINNLGALTIVKQDGTAIASGDIKANKPLSLVRVGSNFFIRSGSGGSNIKSFQSGTTTFSTSDTSKTVTIAGVDLAKAIVRIKMDGNGSGASASFILANAELTNSTTITITRQSANYTEFIYWEVIEFNNVKSLQRGSTTNSVSTISISSVNLSKSLVFASMSTDYAQNWGYSAVVKLISSTQLQITLWNTASSGFYVKWQVIEFN